MKVHLQIILILLVSLTVKATKTIPWKIPDKKIKAVYEIQSKSKRKELVRIYPDGLYEHLAYEIRGKNDDMYVQRNLGRYVMKGHQIKFNEPTDKEFTGEFLSGIYLDFKGKLFSGLFQRVVMPKKYIGKSNPSRKYRKPFFIRYDYDAVVNNKEAEKELDIHFLVNYLMAGIVSEREKADKIVDFIVQSIEYDHEGLEKNKYANSQSDLKAIISGKKRLAVCAGYAHVFNELCKIAGIKSKYITGYTRQTHAEINRLTGAHAWNIVTLDGKELIYDVTWADNGHKTDNTWIDVDPSVMILSHFPESPSDQLLEKPYSAKEFMRMVLGKPLIAGVKLPGFNIDGYRYSKDKMVMSFSGHHNITGYLSPEFILDMVYFSEAPEGRSYIPKIIEGMKVSHSSDSTFLEIPLQKTINPISLWIDKSIIISFVAVNGQQKDLFQYFVDKADNRYGDSFVRGIIAAINLNDKEGLRGLIKENQTVLLDAKGRFKLSKTDLEKITRWQGETTGLTHISHVSSTSFYDKEDAEMKTTKIHKSTLYVGIPSGPCFILERNNGEYTLVGFRSERSQMMYI